MKQLQTQMGDFNNDFANIRQVAQCCQHSPDGAANRLQLGRLIDWVVPVSTLAAIRDTHENEVGYMTWTCCRISQSLQPCEVPP